MDKVKMNILYQQTEKLAQKRARRIENAFKKVMPPWQYRILYKTRSRLLGKIFGWELREFAFNDHFEIWKRGKKYYG